MCLLPASISMPVESRRATRCTLLDEKPESNVTLAGRMLARQRQLESKAEHLRVQDCVTEALHTKLQYERRVQARPRLRLLAGYSTMQLKCVSEGFKDSKRRIIGCARVIMETLLTLHTVESRRHFSTLHVHT